MSPPPGRATAAHKRVGLINSSSVSVHVKNGSPSRSVVRCNAKRYICWPGVVKHIAARALTCAMWAALPLCQILEKEPVS